MGNHKRYTASMRHREQGFAHIGIIILVLAVLAVVGIAIYQAGRAKSGKTGDTATETSAGSAGSTAAAAVSWSFNGETWKASGSSPACPAPLALTLPVDISRISALLYPGQTRGGNYKPHGGFLLTGNNNATVKAPLDARVVHGSRYIEQGEVQYLLFFVNSCGIAYRFDHLLTLSPDMQKLADKLPPATAGDSRTTPFSDNVSVKTGDTIATAVGFRKGPNIGFDLGIYDLRQPNAASANSSFAERHAGQKEQAYYGVCIIDLFRDHSRALYKLPAGDSASGKSSDYCL
jgi:hypothetical protein